MSFSKPVSDFSDSSAETPSSLPELLAPAGTLASLLAGIQSGADAVYMGASRFSARAYAGNFSDVELALGIDYAHVFGKNVYVTLNTLYRDDELDDVVALFDALYVWGIDGVIIQDAGLLNRLACKYPDFPIHASTQMTVHNSRQASFLKNRGVVRVVPARENSVPELKAVKDIGIEIETFIHGALCICYSGQCLFSSLVGSRSGNRGKCAQPCRKRYTLLADGRPVPTEGQYLLSPRDLNASESLEQLIGIGVDSFKIEGRMKKPDYVAGVVSVYRRLIDRLLAGLDEKRPTSEEKETLKKLFNRDFTEGYFLQNPGNELMSRKLPYNKGLLIGKITAIDSRNAQIRLSLTSDLSAHDGISVGDIGKNMNSAEDPRQGFTVKKMYVGRQICSKATAGDTVDIPAPVLFDSKIGDPGAGLPKIGDPRAGLPKIGDPVYKTFDYELQKTLSLKLPAVEAAEIDTLISKTAAFCSNDLLNAVLSPDHSSGEAAYSSSDSFPIPEFIEKLSPAASSQISVSFDCTIRPGSPLLISASDSFGRRAVVRSSYIVEPAQKNSISKEQAQDLLFRVGASVYRIRDARVSVEGDCFVPVGEFKSVRNKALQALLNEIILSRRRFPVSVPSVSSASLRSPVLPSRCPVLAVCVYSADQLNAAMEAGADRIYVGGDVFKDPLTGEEYGLFVRDLEALVSDMAAADKDKIFFRTPFVMKEEDFGGLGDLLSRLKTIGITGLLASNAGVLEFVRSDPRFDRSFRLAADLPFNVFNSDAAALFFEGGVDAVSLSPELSVSHIEGLIRAYYSRYSPVKPPVFECQIHGRQRLMVTEHPLLNTVLLNSPKCAFSGSEAVPAFRYVLKDSKNYMFPVLSDLKNRGFVFNSKELNAFDLLGKLYDAGVSVFRVDGLGHSTDEVKALISLYQKGLSDACSGSFDAGGKQDGGEFTRGSFIRGVE